MSSYMFGEQYLGDDLFNYQATVGLTSLDALTLSFKGEVPEVLNEAVRYSAKVYRARGFAAKNWQVMGYRGWQVGGLRYGIRGDSPPEFLVMVTGVGTNMVAALAEASVKATRIDFAVDYIYEKPLPQIREHYTDVFDAYDEQHNQKRVMKLIRSRNGGFTFYNGARKGEAMIRIYDKGAQKGIGRDKWIRYELEIKKKRAIAGYDGWLTADDKQKYIMGVFQHYCRVNSLLLSQDFGVVVEDIRISSILVDEYDVEKKLLWLKKSVRPCLTKLRDYVTLGSLIEILGLDKYGGI